MNQQSQINPYVLLASVLFNIHRTIKVKVKPDDASPEVEIECATLGAAHEDGAAVCVFPMEDYIKYQATPYDFSMRVENGHCIIAFEKHVNRSTLFTANGEAAPTKSPVIERLLSKLSGGEIGENPIKNP